MFINKTVYVDVIGSLDERKQLHGIDGFKLCGGNTGNVVFCDAAKEQMRFDSEPSYR